jgi:tRNA A-37 threonylcarbamoyl transferase component Bud32
MNPLSIDTSNNYNLSKDKVLSILRSKIKDNKLKDIFIKILEDLELNQKKTFEIKSITNSKTNYETNNETNTETTYEISSEINSDEELPNPSMCNFYISKSRNIFNYVINKEHLYKKEISYTIFKKKGGTNVFKQYYFKTEYQYFRIILEISYQIYSHNILESINDNSFIIKVPKIISFKKISTNIGTSVLIEMEYIKGKSLKDKIFRKVGCTTILNIIKYIDNFLKKNKIYHNDLHSENIYISINNDKINIGIIDFGEATNSLRENNQTFNYNCKSLGRNESKNLNNRHNNLNVLYQNVLNNTPKNVNDMYKFVSKKTTKENTFL